MATTVVNNTNNTNVNVDNHTAVVVNATNTTGP